MGKIKQQIAELLEVDEVKENDILEDFECWDSLTILSIIALASEEYGKTLFNDDIRNAKTIDGLIRLIDN